NGSYVRGLTQTYLVTDGPLQPDHYRLTVKPGVQDRAGNALMQFTRTFQVQGVPGFILEQRNAHSFGAAASLSTTPSTTFDGSLRSVSSPDVGANNPQGFVSAQLTSSGHMDVVTTDYNSSKISVLLGNGDGTFQPAVTYAVGNRPIAVAVGDFNGDAKK